MEVALTTSDNPYNPFTQFDQWLLFDTSHGYNCSSYLANMSSYSNGLSQEMNNMSDEEAIDKIVNLNICGKYKKVYKKDYLK